MTDFIDQQFIRALCCHPDKRTLQVSELIHLNQTKNKLQRHKAECPVRRLFSILSCQNDLKIHPMITLARSFATGSGGMIKLGIHDTTRLHVI